jgi:AraC-like DNA-binding protein
MLKLILLLNPVYVTLFWAVVLNFYSEKKGTPKAFLGKFMAVAFVLYLSHSFYFSGQFHIYRYLDSIYTYASLLVFPLYHIYIRLLTVDKQFSFSKHYIYLVLPTVIFIFHSIGLLLLNKDEQLDFFLEVIPGIHQPSSHQVFMKIIYISSRIVFISQVILYLFLNFKLLIKNKETVENFYSNTDSMRLHWVQFFNISLAITSFASILAALAGREAFADNTLALAIPSLIFSALLFFIGLLGNNQSTVYTPVSENEVLPYQKENDSIIHDIALKVNMDKLFENEMIFKNPELKIWDVCKMIGSNRTYVSRLINNEYNRNFCNHVNYYRVKYAKQLIKANPSLTNEQIAEQSGFGSQNSLHRAFQLIEGAPLKQFRK